VTQEEEIRKIISKNTYLESKTLSRKHLSQKKSWCTASSYSPRVQAPVLPPTSKKQKQKWIFFSKMENSNGKQVLYRELILVRGVKI
jgi:hypothetical protein